MYSGRARRVIFLTVLYNIYALSIAKCFGKISPSSYMLESFIFFAWTVWIIRRPELSTPKTINHDNILLAFYKGDKGSFIMNFFELFDLPVKSLSIIAGDKALYLKGNKKTFEFGNSDKIYKKADDYYIVDTGKPYTDEFIKEMENHSDTLATRGRLRVRCIDGVSGLLGMIGEEFKPKSYIPSLYLRSIIN